jgi:hypothetical protein
MTALEWLGVVTAALIVAAVVLLIAAAVHFRRWESEDPARLGKAWAARLATKSDDYKITALTAMWKAIDGDALVRGRRSRSHADRPADWPQPPYSDRVRMS